MTPESTNGGGHLAVAAHHHLARLAAVDEQARDYAKASKAAATVRAYRSDWRHFTAWCDGYGLEPLPAAAATLARYLTAQAGAVKTNTLQRRLSAIGLRPAPV